MAQFKIAGLTLLLGGMLSFPGALGQVVTTPGRDNQPFEPFRIAERLYYVGASDIASYLLTTSAGHILIDAGYDETVPIVRANMGRLGFHLEDVKILLNTQAHFDHAGGFARMKQLTGARLLVSEADAPLIEQGGRGDFLFGDAALFPPATVDRQLKDRERVRLGGTVLTARLTPGHTRGTTTWSFDASDRGRTYHVVVVGGLTILEGTRLSGMPAYADIARDYAHSFEVLKQLPCDIFLGAHLSSFGGADKAEALRMHPDGPNPFVDAQGYRAYLERSERRFLEQLSREKG